MDKFCNYCNDPHSLYQISYHDRRYSEFQSHEKECLISDLQYVNHSKVHRYQYFFISKIYRKYIDRSMNTPLASSMSQQTRNRQ